MLRRILYEGHRKTYHGDQEVVIKVQPEDTIMPLMYTSSVRLFNLYKYFPKGRYNKGFDWGYVGFQPYLLGLAILLDTTDDEKLSLNHYKDFTAFIIANLGYDWILDQVDIIEWLDTRESKILAENICSN